jgi:hypothetical protein
VRVDHPEISEKMCVEAPLQLSATMVTVRMSLTALLAEVDYPVSRSRGVMKTRMRVALFLSFGLGTSVLSSTGGALTQASPRLDETIRYSVLLGGQRRGAMSVTRDAAALTTHFEYGYGGNGASLDERVALDDNALPRSIEVSGHDFRGNAVRDRFIVEHGMATWDSDIEHGSAPAGPIYLPSNPTPQDYAIVTSVVARAPQGRAKLLPAGTLMVRQVAQREVTAGANRTAATLFAVDGVDFQPKYIWLDEARRLLFNVDAAFSPATIREGFEDLVPELRRAQSEVDEQWHADLARRLARSLTRPLAIRHARLFAAESATVKPDTTVVVDNGRIASVGPDQTVAIPPGAESIDASGRMLLPGLWDMHQHVSGVGGVLDIAAGVTTVRDLANVRDELRRLMDAYTNGTRIGPRVIRSGLVDGPGPLAQPAAVIVNTPDEARRAVDDYAADGYSAIKIYGSLPPSLVPIVAERAHAKGLRVGGHIPAQMTAAGAVAEGYDEINHIPFLVLSLAGPVESANIAVLTATFAQRASAVDPGSEAVRQLIAVLKEHRTVIDPTLYVFEQLLSWRKGTFGAGYEAIGNGFPVQPRRFLLNGGAPIPPGMEGRAQRALEVTSKLLKALHDAGVPIVAGTDFGVYGFATQRELELYVAAGIPAAEVLQLATLGAARVVGEDRELGSIAPGKLGDLVLIDGDPTTRISDIRHATLVVARGRVYEPAKLLAALGIQP